MGSAYFTDCLHTGAVGEMIVANYLVSAGHYVYTCYGVGSHPIDFYVTDVSGHIEYAVDVKTYPRRAYFNDTGIDAGDWYKYVQISLKTPVRLFFIDHFEQCCYSVNLSDAGAVAYESCGKVYIPLDCMKFEFRLNDSQLAAIVPARRSYNYANTRRYFADNSNITVT